MKPKAVKTRSNPKKIKSPQLKIKFDVIRAYIRDREAVFAAEKSV